MVLCGLQDDGESDGEVDKGVRWGELEEYEEESEEEEEEEEEQDLDEEGWWQGTDGRDGQLQDVTSPAQLV